MNIANNLLSAALNARKNAYAPYSLFLVGAAVLADDSQIYAGCNVENMSYPCGTCAEAGAISAMIANGGKKIKEILIVADSQTLITPCGACLQRIAEFAEETTIIHLADLTGVKKSLPVKEMLPYGFVAEELKK